MTGKGKRTDLHGLQEENQVDKFHPFNNIFQALFDIHYGRQMTTPREPSNLTVLQQKLFQFIVPRLAHFESLPALSKKDIYVTSSMIANVDMTGARQCFLVTSITSLRSGGRQQLLGAPRLVDGNYQRCVQVCKASKLCEPEMVKRPKETESMTVKIWHEVFEILFDKTNVSVQTGECGLTASRKERQANEADHGGVRTIIS
ncbi:hypothetical protein BKA57DRAFT_497626, partial [Linnemannia elongata]